MGFLDKLAKYLNKEPITPEVKVEPKVTVVEKPIQKNEIFEKGLDFVLSAEGGYVNDHYDPGGETKYGISHKAYPHIDIANLTLDEAKAIYYRDYWLGSGAKVADISPKLAMILFDTAVNMGTGTAVKFLQRVLRVTEDGVVGEQTRAALEKTNIDEVIHWYMVNRVIRYSDLDTWSRYRRGWLKRVMGLLIYVGKL
jgi:lysozyme family protein